MFTKPADVFMQRARILSDPPEGVSVVTISEFLTAKTGLALPEEGVVSFHK